MSDKINAIEAIQKLQGNQSEGNIIISDKDRTVYTNSFYKTDSGELYIPVKVREDIFKSDYPLGKITNQMTNHNHALKIADFRSFVYEDRKDDKEHYLATGWASESLEVSGRYYVENAETSAKGRALSNAGYREQLAWYKEARHLLIMIEHPLCDENAKGIILDYFKELTNKPDPIIEEKPKRKPEDILNELLQGENTKPKKSEDKSTNKDTQKDENVLEGQIKALNELKFNKATTGQLKAIIKRIHDIQDHYNVKNVDDIYNEVGLTNLDDLSREEAVLIRKKLDDLLKNGTITKGETK